MPCLGDRGWGVAPAVAVRPLAASCLSAALHSTGDMVLEDCGCAPGGLPQSHVAGVLGEDLWASGQTAEV